MSPEREPKWVCGRAWSVVDGDGVDGGENKFVRTGEFARDGMRARRIVPVAVSISRSSVAPNDLLRMLAVKRTDSAGCTESSSRDEESLTRAMASPQGRRALSLYL